MSVESDSQWSRLVAEVSRSLACDVALEPGTPIIASCSGGIDSVCLVHLLAAVRDSYPLAHVVYVDHQLRTAPAERMSAMQAARTAGVAFTAITVNVPRGGNIQENASRARYQALAAFAAPTGAVVATGHTATDQAETVLQRLLRRSGLLGMTGIWPKKGRFIRPMLGISRTALEMLEHPHAEDPTNATDAYQRNRLRKTVLPALSAEEPQAIAALAQSARLAQSEWRLARWLLATEHLSSIRDEEVPADLLDAWLIWRRRVETPDWDPLDQRDTATSAEGPRDPRHTVAAPGFGSYSHHKLRLTVAPEGSVPCLNTPPTTHRYSMQSHDIIWPLTLHCGGKQHTPLLTDGMGRLHDLLPLSPDEVARGGIVHLRIDVLTP